MSYAQAKARHDAASSSSSVDRDSMLLCSAHGCPNRWTVGNGRLCSAHAYAEPERWPEITQVQQWDETERARLRGEPQRLALPSRRVADPARLRVLLRRYADHVRTREQQPRRWAEKLKAREDAGERLTPAQREMWRAALVPQMRHHDEQAAA